MFIGNKVSLCQRFLSKWTKKYKFIRLLRENMLYCQWNLPCHEIRTKQRRKFRICHTMFEKERLISNYLPVKRTWRGCFFTFFIWRNLLKLNNPVAMRSNISVIKFVSKRKMKRKNFTEKILENFHFWIIVWKSMDKIYC